MVEDRLHLWVRVFWPADDSYCRGPWSYVFHYFGFLCSLMKRSRKDNFERARPSVGPRGPYSPYAEPAPSCPGYLAAVSVVLGLPASPPALAQPHSSNAQPLCLCSAPREIPPPTQQSLWPATHVASVLGGGSLLLQQFHGRWELNCSQCVPRRRATATLSSFSYVSFSVNSIFRCE